MSVDEEYIQKVMRTLSHDLGAALRAASGFSRLLVDQYSDKLDEKALHWLSLIQQEGEGAQEKLESLSFYARLYGVDDELVACDLLDICHQVVKDNLAAFPHLSVDVGPLPTVKGYERLWASYFLHILSNSGLHGADGECVNCLVFAEVHEDRIRLIVDDDGVGIKPLDAEKAMLPYRTLSKGGGAGMGIPMAKRIVEIHGGQLILEASSSVGGGLRVIADIPAAFFD